MTVKLHKAIIITLLCLCFSSGLSLPVFDWYYSRTRPHQPQQSIDKTYLHYVKTPGYIGPVYLSRTDQIPHDYAPYVIGTFALAAYLLNRHWYCFAPFRR
jgi:hypothetical protein